MKANPNEQRLCLGKTSGGDDHFRQKLAITVNERLQVHAPTAETRGAGTADDERPTRDDSNERQQQDTTYNRDSGLTTLTAAVAANNSGLRQLWWQHWQRMTMAMDNNGMQELATDDNGQGTRPGDEQRRHYGGLVRSLAHSQYTCGGR